MIHFHHAEFTVEYNSTVYKLISYISEATLLRKRVYENHWHGISIHNIPFRPYNDLKDRESKWIEGLKKPSMNKKFADVF